MRREELTMYAMREQRTLRANERAWRAAGMLERDGEMRRAACRIADAVARAAEATERELRALNEGARSGKAV